MEHTNKTWMNPIGYWDVSTEGDCEGRSMRRLGIFKGHFADIALALADKCCYTLWFTKVDEDKMILPKIQTKDEVDIAFSDSTGVDCFEMCKELRPILEKDNIFVTRGGYTGHIKVSREETVEMKKAKAIAKLKGVLNDEEMSILGL